MTTRRATRAILLAFVLCPGLFVSPAQAQDARAFKARLSPTPLDVSMQSRVAGSGSVTATVDRTTVTIAGTFEGLRSPATVARLHRGYRGIRGPAFADLKVTSATSGTLSGTIELTPSQMSDLQKSLFYIQLHSEKAPEGNLWGWLLPAEEQKK